MNKFHAQYAVNQEGIGSTHRRLVVECSCGSVFPTLVLTEFDTEVRCGCGRIYGWFTDKHELEPMGVGHDERAHLLKEAQAKPIRSFVQVDYFNEDAMYITPTRELNASGCLRLMIPAGQDLSLAIQGVKEMLACLEDGDFPKSLLDPAPILYPSVANDHFDPIPF